MYERFTDSALKIMRLANLEANKLNHSSIETSHLLLGMLTDELVVGIFKVTGLDPNLLRLEVERGLSLADAYPPVVTPIWWLPIGDMVQLVLCYTKQEAVILKDEHIDSEHLLLGFVRFSEELNKRKIKVAHVLNFKQLADLDFARDVYLRLRNRKKVSEYMSSY